MMKAKNINNEDNMMKDEIDHIKLPEYFFLLLKTKKESDTQKMFFKNVNVYIDKYAEKIIHNLDEGDCKRTLHLLFHLFDKESHDFHSAVLTCGLNEQTDGQIMTMFLQDKYGITNDIIKKGLEKNHE